MGKRRDVTRGRIDVVEVALGGDEVEGLALGEFDKLLDALLGDGRGLVVVLGANLASEEFTFRLGVGARESLVAEHLLGSRVFAHVSLSAHEDDGGRGRSALGLGHPERLGEDAVALHRGHVEANQDDIGVLQGSAAAPAHIHAATGPGSRIRELHAERLAVDLNVHVVARRVRRGFVEH